MEIILWCCLAGLLGLAGGAFIAFKLVRRQDRLNLNSAQNRAAEILAQAAQGAENVRKEAELKAKDEVFQKREEFNREVDHAKGELRDQERRLEKREDSIEQKHQLQLKKERLLQHNEKKVHERKEALEAKIRSLCRCSGRSRLSRWMSARTSPETSVPAEPRTKCNSSSTR